MSDLMVFDAVKMNSIEIAELVESRHANIIRSIERLIEGGVIRSAPMEFLERINNLGFKVKDKVYVFEGEQGKRDSIIVVAQNCPEFTARLVDRWQELENLVQQNAPAIPQTLSEALRLAADLAEEKERLALVNKELAPKAAVCDAIVKNDMHRTASEVAKPLGMSAVKLNRKLSAVGVYDLRCRRRVFSQWFIDEGYGKMRVTHDGYEQAVFTAKGQVWITELLTCN
ncbi:TPA: phage regulatory protein/antirepressor Ant [Escherichia coli]|nr:phage regulatory protein/antirepressor Ant [Escherichia coli]